MKQMWLKSVLKRKIAVKTDSNHVFPIVKKVLNRVFKNLQIGKKWISDITYIRVNHNWNYLTTIIGLADRKVVNWTLSEDMTAQKHHY